MFPDKATNRKILAFIIKCPSEGCQWTGELRFKDVRHSISWNYFNKNRWCVILDQTFQGRSRLRDEPKDRLRGRLKDNTLLNICRQIFKNKEQQYLNIIFPLFLNKIGAFRILLLQSCFLYKRKLPRETSKGQNARTLDQHVWMEDSSMQILWCVAYSV